MKRFSHLNIPEGWQQYWSRYPQGYTIIEALINWVSQVDDMVDNVNDWNAYLDNFVEQFDTSLQGKVIDTLSEWQSSGFLDVVIDQALETKFHEMDDRLSLQLSQNLEDLQTREINALFPPNNIEPIKNDGSDNANSLNECLQYLSSNGGGTLYIPSGMYMINDNVHIHQNCHVRGAGKGVTTIYWDPLNTSQTGLSMFQFENNDEHTHSSISNISLNQKRTERGLKDQQSASAIGLASNALVDNVEIFNTVGPGIDRSGIENVSIINSDIYNTGHHPIYFSTGSRGISNVTIDNCYLGTPAYIFERVLGANIFKLRYSNSGDLIKNVRFTNNKLGLGRDSQTIFISTTTGEDLCRLENMVIENNVFNVDSETILDTNQVIYLGGTSQANNVTIHHNIVETENIAQTAFNLLHAEGENITISENIIKGFDIGIYSRYSDIHKNDIHFYQSGISNSTESFITNNNLLSSTNEATGLYRNNHAVITGNDIDLTGSNTTGIDIGTTANKMIMNNNISNCLNGIIRSFGNEITGSIIDKNIFTDCDNEYVNIGADQIRDNIFEPSIKDRHGFTSNRPIAKYVGERYYDTTLGKPIWWRSSSVGWVDANGEQV